MDSEALPSTTATQAILRIPPFWTHDPTLWFAHVEAQFYTQRILSDVTKFNHVVAALTHEVMAEVRDLIIAPPGSISYDYFKSELIRRTTDSQQSAFVNFS